MRGNYTPSNMKKTGKQNIIPLVILMIATAAAGAILFKLQFDSRTKAEEKEPEKIYDGYYAYVSESDDEVFWQEVYEGALAEGEETDICIEDFASGLKSGYSAAERIRIAVWSGVDGIIAEGKSTAFKNALKEAKDAGIPVVLLGTDDAETGRVSFVGASGYDLGLLYGKQAAGLSKQILNRKDRVTLTILSRQDDAGTTQDLLINTIRDSLLRDEDFNNRITINTVSVAAGGTFASQEAVTDILFEAEKEGSVPDIIIALSGELTNSAYQGILDLNLTGDCNIIGYYATDTIREAIENENVYSTILIDAKEMGSLSVDALSEYRESGYVSEYYPVDSSVLSKEDPYENGEEER